MALFGNKKSKSTHSNKISSATIITSCMQITGNLQGDDTLHIDGTVTGNITVNNTLVVGKSGKVEGNIEAKSIIINGEVKGEIRCEHLEVMKEGKVSHSIKAKTLILDGKVEGDIVADTSIDILEHGIVASNSLESKTITVNGEAEGNITASKILTIHKQGFVQGKIRVKNIKTEEGGRVIGTMATYQDKSSSLKEKTVTQKKNPST